MRHELEAAHISDTHIGFKQYTATSPGGKNQREQDFSRALLRNMEDIVEWDPPLVIHSGDFFDGSRPSNRHILQGRDAVSKLASDGRVVVIAAGNHDMPADATEACSLELYNSIPGVLVATNKYAVHDLSKLVAAGQARPELDDVVVHLLPHEALKHADWDAVRPVEGKTNILVTHCVVGGSDLYKRSIGREYALPIDVVVRGWDYVALGHYHKQGPVAVGGLTEATSPAWYAGSTENNGYSDVRENKSSGGRGYLRVNIHPNRKVPHVAPRDLEIRAMFRLPIIDATNMDSTTITETMKDTVRNAAIRNAVVRQVVTHVQPDIWNLVDIASVRAAAAEALWYEAKPEFAALPGTQSEDSDTGPVMSSLAAVLDEVIDGTLGRDHRRADVERMATALLGDALDATLDDDHTCGEDHHDAQVITLPTTTDTARSA